MSGTAAPASESLRIALVHPDLGLGGAERLVVDAASALRDAGHRVVLFTAHHDPARCLPETRDGSLDVRVHGRRLPFDVGGRLRAPCTILRTLWASAAAARRGPWDLVFCDVVPHALPLLKRQPRVRVLFYCHYPDRLLAPARGGWYRAYRVPLDRIEEATLGLADRVLVNSRYTGEVFRRTFRSLRGLEPEVLYPGVDCVRHAAVPPLARVARNASRDGFTILCLGRYAPDKNAALAVEALAALRARLDPARFERVRLVVAGGYDARLPEARATLAGLDALARRLGLRRQLELARSLSESERLDRLRAASCLLHPSLDEHLGVVPLEAMAAGRPVLAVDRGGPRETLRHGETGFLCAPTPGAFADSLARLAGDPEGCARMGEAARVHVQRHFSREVFAARLDGIVREMTQAGFDVASARKSAHSAKSSS